MSGIRGEVRPHDAASGENRRRNAETGHQPLGLVTEIDAADRYQVAVTSQQHQSLPKCELFAAPICNASEQPFGSPQIGSSAFLQAIAVQSPPKAPYQHTTMHPN